MIRFASILSAAAVLLSAASAGAVTVDTVGINARATVTSASFTCGTPDDVPCPFTGPQPVVGDILDISGGFTNIARFGPYDPNGTTVVDGLFDKTERFAFDIRLGSDLLYRIDSQNSDLFDNSFSLTLSDARVTGFWLVDLREAFDRTTFSDQTLDLRYQLLFDNEDDGSTIDYTYALTATIDPSSLRITQTPAIPEPASWAMLITGFGVIGAALRRRTAATA